MGIHDEQQRHGAEGVLALHDPSSGLRGFVVFADAAAPCSFGGVRRRPYADEAEALEDGLRLAGAMARKLALHGINAGGAKSVLFEAPDAAAAYRRLGEVLEGLGGRYMAGPDVGTGPRELAWMAERTDYVTRPGPDGPGDLGVATAMGVLGAIEAAFEHHDGTARLVGRSVLVQGLGRVGGPLAAELSRRGAIVQGTDPDPVRRGAAERFGVHAVPPGDELDAEVELFCPCALGGVLGVDQAERLRARIVCGAANNPLVGPEAAFTLHRRGISYVPDYVANAGAILLGTEHHMHAIRPSTDDIRGRIRAVSGEILEGALARGESPESFAFRLAQSRMDERRERPISRGGSR